MQILHRGVQLGSLCIILLLAAGNARAQQRTERQPQRAVPRAGQRLPARPTARPLARTEGIASLARGRDISARIASLAKSMETDVRFSKTPLVGLVPTGPASIEPIAPVEGTFAKTIRYKVSGLGADGRLDVASRIRRTLAA